MENRPLTRSVPPTLPKWPFFLGDLLLVGLAVFVIFRAEGMLNSWQIAFCVLGVVIGGLLLVAPFVIEFYLKQKLHEATEVEAIETISRRINTAVGEVMELTREQKGEKQKLEHTLGAYEGLAGLLDKKVRALEGGLEGLEALQKAQQGLEARLEAIEGTLGDLDPLSPKTLKKELEALPGRLPAPDFTGLEERIRSALDRSVEGLETKLRELEERLSQREAPSAVKAEGQDAIEVAAEAVLQGEAPQVDVSPLPGDTETEEVGEGPEPNPDQGNLLPAERRMLEKAIGPTRTEASLPQRPVQRIIEKEAAGPAPLPEEEETEADKPEDGKRAALLANILIGIGNKLYVRGEGTGLSWSEGQPMEFVEIGLYRWTSANLEEPIQVQIYLNDEISALGDPIRLRPGEELEVTPDFPS